MQCLIWRHHLSLSLSYLILELLLAKKCFDFELHHPWTVNLMLKMLSGIGRKKGKRNRWSKREYEYELIQEWYMCDMGWRFMAFWARNERFIWARNEQWHEWMNLIIDQTCGKLSALLTLILRSISYWWYKIFLFATWSPDFMSINFYSMLLALLYWLLNRDIRLYLLDCWYQLHLGSMKWDAFSVKQAASRYGG